MQNGWILPQNGANITANRANTQVCPYDLDTPANFFYIYPQMLPQNQKTPLTLEPLTQALRHVTFGGSKNVPQHTYRNSRGISAQAEGIFSHIDKIFEIFAYIAKIALYLGRNTSKIAIRVLGGDFDPPRRNVP